MALSEPSGRLPSTDFNASKEFYSEKLGFELISEGPDTLVFRRDSVELHLRKCDERPSQSSGVYIQVLNIEDWYAECQARNIVEPAGAGLQLRPYGMKEFIVEDCHGNSLKFGEPVLSQN